MKSQASKTLSLKKLSVSELNIKELKKINGGSFTLNPNEEYDVPTSQNTVSTRLCNPNDGVLTN